MTIMPAPSVFQQPQVIPNQSGSGPSASSTDPTASLREAALLSLKSRRRNLGSGSEPASIPPRPQTVHVTATEPSIQLDYGQEDPSGASSTNSSAPTVAPPPMSATPEPNDDDDQSREEGEISDSEPPLASPAVKPKVVPQAKPQTAPKNVSKPSTSGKPPSIPSSGTTPTKTIASTVPTQSVSASMPPPSLPLPYRLDENHVRPGLEMTQAQYDAAKDIVLDLLGWGVPPDYLVSCGVSREIMFYVFTELNLRLPSNFDAAGIPPYPPVPTDFMSTPTTSVTTRLDSMSLHPENGVAKANDHGSDNQMNLSATAATFFPSTPSPSSAGPNLYDMEQQRRQELLARKAAIASRKKQVAPVAASAAKEPKDVEMADTIPTKTVEDFLKSIGPTEDTSKGKAPARPGSALSRSTTIEDAMDVDEVIPGLSIDTMMTATTPKAAPAARTPPPVISTPITTIRPQSAADSITSASNLSPQSTASSSGERSPTNTSPSEAEAVPGLAFNIAAPVPEASRRAPLARRGTKRPVAADFDDDARPRTARPPPVYANGNPYHQPSYKRNVGSFAGLSGMRRCVIDLSDSEEEEEEEEEGAISTTSRPPSVARVGPLRGASISRQSPPRYDSATPTGALTPAVLQEKEEEIRKMRELIKQREQSRLRKLAIASRSTPPTVDMPTNGGPTASVNREEDPFPSAFDGRHSSTGSNTPIPLTSIPSSSSTTISIPPTPIDIVANSFLDTTTGERGEWLLNI